MKTSIVSLVVILTFFVFTVNTASAEIPKERKAKSVQDMVEQKTFRFLVQYVHGFGGADEYISNNSMITVNQSSFVCYLPAYAGLDFTSNNITYKLSVQKKKYLITVQDGNEKADQFLFVIDKNGYGTVKVLHPNGSSIDFGGIMTSIKQ